MLSSNKVFKDIKIFWTVHSRPFIRYQGKNLDWFWIWCCFQFFLYCLVEPNQDIHSLLHGIFIIRIRLWIIQAVNLYFLCFCNIALKYCFSNWLELFPWYLTFSEFIVSVFNRLKFTLIINTFSLSLKKYYFYTDNKIVLLLKVLLYASASSLSKSSKFFILKFLVKSCKLHSLFKIPSKSHMLDLALISSVYYKCSDKLWFHSLKEFK